jgi:hypothetical protein
MKKSIFSAVLLAAGLSFGAQAAEINVGGVVWDPSENVGNGFPSLNDFFAAGNIIEDAATGAPGQVLTGFGEVQQFNSEDPNQASFCPGCELTFTFSMTTVSFNIDAGFLGVVPNIGSFEFTDLEINFWVDDSEDFAGTSATAGNGDLWLKFTSDLLSGDGFNLGTGSDSGSGTALIDAVGGLAMSNFDTNGEANGADALLSSSFQDFVGRTDTLRGTFEISGNSIPEPSSIALLGLGILGLGLRARKKKATK